MKHQFHQPPPPTITLSESADLFIGCKNIGIFVEALHNFTSILMYFQSYRSVVGWNSVFIFFKFSFIYFPVFLGLIQICFCFSFPSWKNTDETAMQATRKQLSTRYQRLQDCKYRQVFPCLDPKALIVVTFLPDLKNAITIFTVSVINTHKHTFMQHLIAYYAALLLSHTLTCLLNLFICFSRYILSFSVKHGTLMFETKNRDMLTLNPHVTLKLDLVQSNFYFSHEKAQPLSYDHR